MTPQPLVNYRDTFKKLLATTPTHGDIAEFGVFGGGATLQLVEEGKWRRVWAFDTFKGLPQECFIAEIDGQANLPGKFDIGGVPDILVKDCRIIPMIGRFEYTLPKILGLTKFELVYVDCDYYKSHHEVFAWLPMFLLPKAGIVFDDYTRLDGAKRAIDEFTERWDLTLHEQHYTIWDSPKTKKLLSS